MDAEAEPDGGRLRRIDIRKLASRDVARIEEPLRIPFDLFDILLIALARNDREQQLTAFEGHGHRIETNATAGCDQPFGISHDAMMLCEVFAELVTEYSARCGHGRIVRTIATQRMLRGELADQHDS